MLCYNILYFPASVLGAVTKICRRIPPIFHVAVPKCEVMMGKDDAMSVAVGKDLCTHSPTPGSIATSISLLPKHFIEFCELVNYDYASTPLPRAIAVGVPH